MRFNATHIAAAAALALVSTASVAAPNRALANYTTGTSDVYIAGSSAVDLALVKFVANACNPNTVDVYRSDAGVRTYYLITCETTVAGGGFALPSGNSKLAIHKNTNSSGDGVTTVLNTATTVNYLQVSDVASTAGCSEVTVPATTGIAAYQLFTCGTTIGTAGAGTLVSAATSTAGTLLTHFGLADSEPLQFTTAANALQLRSGYPFGLIFGVPVSTNLRDALQAQQGLTVGSETEANMPSLTSSQINGIFTSKYSTWTDALGVTIPGNDNIYKVRRSATSGTTRIFNASFIGEFCTPGVTASTAGTAVTTPVTQCATVAGAGATLQAATSDDMASCISTVGTTGGAAIGHLSTDYQPQAADGYRFVKVDGYAPTVLNVVDGKYKVWSELSFNYNNGRMAAGIAGTSADAALNDAGAVFARFRTASADANYLKEVITGLTQVGGWVGGLVGAAPNALTGNAGFGLPATGALGSSLTLPRTAASVLAYPANVLSRVNAGRVNLCVPATPATAGYKAQ